MLETFKPSIIKCDIEGAEYDLPWYLLDSYPDVRMVIMELHLTKRGHRDKARNICGDFHDMAFDFTKKPHIGEKNWTTIARFER